MRGLLNSAALNSNLLSAAGFIWHERIREVLWIVLFSMIPTFEGRYALIVGHSWGMSLAFAYFLALIASTIPMFFIFLLVNPVLTLMRKTGIRFIVRFADWIELRGRRGAEKVSKRGLLGLFLFVAAPIPGTGVWSGTLIAVLMGFNRPRAMLAIALGNVVACLIMALATYGILNFIPFL